MDKGLQVLGSPPVVGGRGEDPEASEALGAPLGCSVPGLAPLNVH